MSNGKILDGGELVSLGLKQLRKGFFITLFGMFYFGYYLFYFILKV